ncbi:hypothetical protein ACWC8S_32100, partial [Streptomyces fungicidicus]
MPPPDRRRAPPGRPGGRPRTRLVRASTAPRAGAPSGGLTRCRTFRKRGIKFNLGTFFEKAEYTQDG